MKKWILLMLLSAPLYGAEIKECVVIFETTANPGLLNISGDGGKCTGTITEKGGKYSAVINSKLNDYQTGISLRNSHLRDKYLETKKYPTAELSFKDEADDGEIDAQLKIKSDIKPVKVIYETKGKVVTAKFSFNIKDYPSIGVPSWLGVTAAERVDVTVILAK